MPVSIAVKPQLQGEISISPENHQSKGGGIRIPKPSVVSAVSFERDNVIFGFLTNVLSVAAADSQVSEAIDREIEAMYRFEDKERVLAYIHLNNLLPALREIAPKVRAKFPQETIRLRVVEDPEIDGYDHLVASVLVTEPPREVFQKFSNMQDEWICDLLAKNSRLMIDVEYE